MNHERRIEKTASLPDELSEALAFYDSLAERIDRAVGTGGEWAGHADDEAHRVSTRDEARKLVIARFSDWAEHLREHFRIEDCLLGVNDSPFDSTQLGMLGESLPDSPGGPDSRPFSDACHAAASPPFIPRYLLGVGGQGEVWLAHDPQLDRFVALKVIKPDQRGSASTAARFWREAELTGQLEHPNIVPVYAAGHAHHPLSPAMSSPMQPPPTSGGEGRGEGHRDDVPANRHVEAQADISTLIAAEQADVSTPHLGPLPHIQLPSAEEVFSVGEREDVGSPYYVMRVFGNRHLLRAITAFHARPRSQQDWILLNAIKAFHEKRTSDNDQRLQQALSEFPFGDAHPSDQELKAACEALRSDPAGQSGRSLQEAITAYHASGRQPSELRELLNRFIDVCNAMAYAHSQGVIHRDLKPQNVMLGEFGETLVVDWGLAKVLSTSVLPSPPGRGAGGEGPSPADNDRDANPHTQQGTIVGTLAYMPPEQAWGKVNELTPAADVFSLGGILYCILTGQPPLAGVTRTQLLDAARSAKVAAPTSVQPDISKALEAVALKALAKTPSQRYATAKDLAADITRWLADDPVTAWPEPMLIRARRWMNNHRTLVGSTAAAVLVAVVTLSTLVVVVSGKNSELKTAYENLDDRNEQLTQANADLVAANQREQTARLAAQEQSQLALETLTEVVIDVQNSLANLPGGAEVRRQLLATSLEKLELVAGEYVEQTVVDRNTMVALRSMGDIIRTFGAGEQDADLLRDDAGVAPELSAEQQTATASAQQFYMRAHEIAEALATIDPTSDQAQWDLATSCGSLGTLHYQLGNTESAREFYTQAHDICERMAAADPSDNVAQRALSISYVYMGDVHLQTQDLEQARDYFQQALDMCQLRYAANPTNRRAQRDLWVMYDRLVYVYLQMGDTESARDFCQQNADLCERRAAADPANGETQEDLATSYARMGELYQQLGDANAARDFHQKANDIYTELAAFDSDHIEAQRDLSVSYEQLGDVHLQLGEMESAGELFQQSLGIRERLAAADPTNGTALRDLAIAYEKLGDVHLQLEETESARDFYQQQVDIRERLAAADPANGEELRNLANSYEQLGDVYLQLEETESARNIFEQLLDVRERLATADPTNGQTQRELAVCYGKLGNVNQQLGDPQSALDYHQRKVDIYENLAAADPTNDAAQRDLSGSYVLLGNMHLQMGETDTARDFLQWAIDIFRQLAAADPSNSARQRDLAISQISLGEVYLSIGDTDTAREVFQETNDTLDHLAAVDPTDSLVQRGLSLSHERLGDVQLQLGDMESALSFLQQSLDVRERLATGDSASIQAQRELASLYDKLGNVHLQTDNTQSARDFYTQSLDIRERLAAADPTSNQAQRDLSISYDKLGNVHLQLWEHELARGFYEQSYDIDQRLATDQPANYEAQRKLSLSYYNFARVSTASWDFEAAFEQYARAIAILDPMIENGQDVVLAQQQREFLTEKLHAAESRADRARAALADWDTFVANPDHESLLAMRITLLSRQGRFDEIPQLAAISRSLAAEDVHHVYDAACGYALCANAIQPMDGAELTPEQLEQRQEFINLALACLREAITAGYNNSNHMRHDPELAVLRDLPEFEALLNTPPPAE